MQNFFKKTLPFYGKIRKFNIADDPRLTNVYTNILEPKIPSCEKKCRQILQTCNSRQLAPCLIFEDTRAHSRCLRSEQDCVRIGHRRIIFKVQRVEFKRFPPSRRWILIYSWFHGIAFFPHHFEALFSQGRPIILFRISQ